MDAEYLAGNVAEARGEQWQAADTAVIDDHVHCLICWSAISAATHPKYFRCEHASLCGDCHARYIPQNEG